MCDYSLMALPNRLAVNGEELVVHRFETGCIGLASPIDLRAIQQRRENQPDGLLPKIRRFFAAEEPCCAICIPPGASLLLRDIAPRLQKKLRLDADVHKVEFTQIGTVGFRDAVRFSNGAEVLLQRLHEGQRVTVLSLSSDERQEAVSHQPALAE